MIIIIIIIISINLLVVYREFVNLIGYSTRRLSADTVEPCYNEVSWYRYSRVFVIAKTPL